MPQQRKGIGGGDQDGEQHAPCTAKCLVHFCENLHHIAPSADRHPRTPRPPKGVTPLKKENRELHKLARFVGSGPGFSGYGPLEEDLPWTRSFGGPFICTRTRQSHICGRRTKDGERNCQVSECLSGSAAVAVVQNVDEVLGPWSWALGPWSICPYVRMSIFPGPRGRHNAWGCHYQGQFNWEFSCLIRHRGSGCNKRNQISHNWKFLVAQKRGKATLIAKILFDHWHGHLIIHPVTLVSGCVCVCVLSK